MHEYILGPVKRIAHDNFSACSLITKSFYYGLKYFGHMSKSGEPYVHIKENGWSAKNLLDSFDIVVNLM